MEYTELIKIIFNPVVNFINDIYKKLHSGGTFPIQDESGRWIIPNGYWDHEMNRFNREHKPTLDARLLIRDFLKQLDPDIRQDIEKDMMRHIMKLIVALIKLRGEQEVNHIFPFIDGVREYLFTLKNTIEPATRQKQIKPYKSKNMAMALCLLKAKIEGKIDTTIWYDKNKIQDLIKDKFPKASYRVYAESRNEYLWEKRHEHPENLKYALELYNKHFEKPG